MSFPSPDCTLLSSHSPLSPGLRCPSTCPLAYGVGTLVHLCLSYSCAYRTTVPASCATALDAHGALAPGSDDWTAKQYSMSTGECIRTFEGHDVTTALALLWISQMDDPHQRMLRSWLPCMDRQ